MFPELNNFQGLVYRGLRVSHQEFAKFKETLNITLEKRVISIPLSMWSASLDMNVACNFMFLRRVTNEELNVMLEIHVVEMIPEDL